MTETREEIEQWAALSDEDWVALQVPRFAAIRPRCLLYAEFLQSLLKQACAQTRASGLDRGACQEHPQFRGKNPPQTQTLHASERRVVRRSARPHDGPLRRARHRADFGPGADRVPVHRGGVRHRPAPTARTSASDCVPPSSATARCITSSRSMRRSCRRPASRSPFPRKSSD